MFEDFLGLFFLGVATFLSPCSIALISVYLTYGVGISKSIRRGLIVGCSFAIAMCLIFFVLGYAIASLIPLNLVSYPLFLGISGVLLILFGINNLGWFKKVGLITKTNVSFTERLNALRLNALTRFSRYNYVIGSFLFGVVISIALGPCSLSLVLPAVLLTLFAAPTAVHGGLLLFMFGLGHALPVIGLSVLLATARTAVSAKITAGGELLTRVFGLVFLVIGVIMIVYAFGGW